MAKRFLTEQQKARIKQYQAEKATGQVGLIVAHYGSHVDVVDQHEQTTRCKLRQSLPALVVGDEVLWQLKSTTNHSQSVDDSYSAEDFSATGVVVAQLPRRNSLCRPDSRGRFKPVAANIDQMLIVMATQPMFSWLMLDSYLVAAELNNIKPLIVLNKIDLVTASELSQLAESLSIYQRLGYEVLLISIEKPETLLTLSSVLNDQISVFVGQSGVGKSSLIQRLLPDELIPVGAVSAVTKMGRHTTTTAKFYRLPEGGAVIDSPGVREFGLGELNSTDLAKGFVEFSSYLGNCRFRNCEHREEPNCALKEAVHEGKIASSRWENFNKLRGS